MSGFLLWYLQESNQGHMDFQSIALPTELRYHYVLQCYGSVSCASLRVQI